MNTIKRAKQTLLLLLCIACAYVIADNVAYQFTLNQRTQITFAVRHEGNMEMRHAPPSHIVQISDANLFKDAVDFRTGRLGNILPDGGDGPCGIVFLGGSTTESHWVPETKRWPFLVGNHASLRPFVRTYNFGVGGQNIHHSLIKYVMVMGQLKPMFVVVNHQANDLGKIINGGYYFSEQSDLYNSYSVSTIGFDFGKTLKQILAVLAPLSHHTWREFSNRRSVAVRSGTTAAAVRPPEMVFDGYFARLKALQSFVEAEGGRLILINEPNRSRQLLLNTGRRTASGEYLESLLTSKDISAENYLKMLEDFSSLTRLFAIKENIILLDAQTDFPTVPDYFYDSIHFTPSGAEAFAAYVVAEIADAILQECALK